MKILTRYILREHTGPFFFAFSVITFILIMDFILEIIDTIVSKALDPGTVLELFALNLAWMLALSIPMAILVATLMAFGRLAADNEISALKSSGINPLRIILPVMITAMVVMVLMIQFNNRILPDANHKARLLMSDISQKRPALRLEPNIFIDDIPGYHILIKKINPRTSEIADITIYDQKDRHTPRTIVAEKGSLAFDNSRNTLIFTLYNGEIHEVDDKAPAHYRRVAFDKQIVYLHDIGSDLVRTESDYRTDRELSAKAMRIQNYQTKQQVKNTEKQLNVTIQKHLEAVLKPVPLTPSDKEQIPKARAAANAAIAEQIFLNQIREHLITVKNLKRQINSMAVEIDKKYAIPVACIIFIMVGAPLGIRTRRGGFGTSAGISLGFFIFYWACLIGGEELANRSIISAFVAMWTANIVLGLVGLYMLFLTQQEQVSLLPDRIRRGWSSLRLLVSGLPASKQTQLNQTRQS